MSRILVVDDNATNLELMLYLLRAFGHQAEGFTQPVQALEHLRDHRYDAILVDIRMPQMDGFEFAQRVNELRRDHGSLIAVTALAMVGDKERIVNSGFDGYIAKPIDPERFVREIEEIQRRGHAVRPGGPKILVVDDVQVNIDVIRGVLAPSGYVVIEAPNAIAAIAKLKEHRPALILSDVHMKGGDGFLILEHVMEDAGLRDIPFYFISSTMWQTSERRMALERGARKFLQRPIEPVKLLEEVREALGETQHG